MTAGVRLHGLALATPMARRDSTPAAPSVIRVSATPLDRWYDCPSTVETTANAAATHSPSASTASAIAATLSGDRRGCLRPAGRSGRAAPDPLTVFAGRVPMSTT